jgi:SAM-dependent methyltransferase
MSWDPVWEKIFREKTRWGNYPPEELVRFIAMNYYDVPKRTDVKILEIGCGPGGGPSWFLALEGFSFYGIDGSKTAIIKAKKRFSEEGLNGTFFCRDISKLEFEDNYFDCIIDVACLQHNPEPESKSIITELYRVLKKNGKHFSITAKAGCWGDGTGRKIDNTSHINITEGPFQNMGVIRFATEESLRTLYSKFHNINLEYSIRSVNNREHEISNWILTCEK